MALLFEENKNIEAQILAAEFRINGVNENDTLEIMNFKSIVKAYLKMEGLEAK